MLDPDLYLRSVLDIDLEALRAQGVRALLMDLDNTLLPRDSTVVPEDVIAWAASLPERGIQVVLVSNNWHERVTTVAEELGFMLVSKAVKPLPFAFLRALSCAGVRKADRRSGRRPAVHRYSRRQAAGHHDRSSSSRCLASDLPHTLMLRHLEKVLLGRAPARVEAAARS